MDERYSSDFRIWVEGQRDAKIDHIIRQNEAILHQGRSHALALDATISAWKRYTKTQHLSGQTSGKTSRPPASQGAHTDESLIMVALRHLAPKAILWALARAFGIALQFAMPILILGWALTQKWLGIWFGWLSALLG